jgi:hypothetical protein
MLKSSLIYIKANYLQTIQIDVKIDTKHSKSSLSHICLVADNFWEKSKYLLSKSLKI